MIVRKLPVLLVYVLFCSSGLLIGILSGCATKAITKPRSAIISDLQAKGIEVPSLEEEKAWFFAQEQTQKDRVFQLIEKRAAGPIRDDQYRIGPGDKLEINVFDVEELNVEVRVRQSGFISLPLVGAVMAGGMTESEFQEELQKRLSAYVRNPQVNVYIGSYGSQQVAVIGAVYKPGTYSLKKGTNSILELISMAGGLTEKAGSYVNFIPTEITGVTANTEVEAKAKLSLASTSTSAGSDTGIELWLDQVLGTGGGIPLEIPVQGGDMIIIPEAGKINVEGELEKTGSVELGKNMTLLGALAAAGGITYSANIEEVEIVRDFGAERPGRLVVDLTKVAGGDEKDVRLRNGDLVRIPSATGRRLSQDTFNTITQIINFGIGGSVNLAN